MRIGVLGGGQLGRMLGLAGIPLGLNFRYFDSSPASPAVAAGELICGRYDDPDALSGFAAGCDVITYEFENVPVQALNHLQTAAPVRPGRRALEVSQDRVHEKTFFAEAGVEAGEWRKADSLEELKSAVSELGDCIIKTRRMGYDGKGQIRISDAANCAKAWEMSSSGGLIVEKLVPFDRELSQVAVRGVDGEIRFWPLVENVHQGGILHKTTAPAANVERAMQVHAESMLASILERLDYVGVLTVEFFEVEGKLLANEMAPRVHNSGHWTIEGCVTSQFENHVRAIAGLPLGSAEARFASVMINCIGSMPPAESVLRHDGVHLHDYGKSAREGRKVGHITVCDEPATGESLVEKVAQLEKLVTEARVVDASN